MRQWRIGLFCLAGVAALPALAPPQPQAPAGSSWESQAEVAPGVTYRHLQSATPAGEPWSAHVLEVSRKERHLEVRAVEGQGADGAMQRELPSAMGARAGAARERVLAVINGDFDLEGNFLGIPMGLSVTSGRLWTAGTAHSPSLALLGSGQATIAVPEVRIELVAGKRKWAIGALNKPFGAGYGPRLRLYTREFRPALRSGSLFEAVVIGRLSKSLPLRVDSEVQGEVLEVHEATRELAILPEALVVAERLPAASNPPGASRSTVPLTVLRPGDRVKLRLSIQVAGKKGVRQALGGFPILVENGGRHIASAPSAHLARRHPRTAACINDRKIIFAVVDGRQPQLSVGMTLEELADLMVSLGCSAAMNADGGGSSVMAVALPPGSHLRILNSPSDGQERERPNAWVVVWKE